MSDDKQKNEFIVIDENEKPKRKRKPLRSFTPFILSVVILLFGFVIGAGAILFLVNRNVEPMLPIVAMVPTIPAVRESDDWQLAFIESDNIYNISSKNSEPQRIIEWAESPLLSPDGTHIAYQRDETDTTHLYIARSNGSFEQRVDDDEGVYEFSYAWSPDSTMLAYMNGLVFDNGVNINNAVLRLVDVESGESQTLVSTNIHFGTIYRWSPDGTRIAFIGTDARIYLVDVSTGDMQNFFVGFAVSPNFLAWSPTGSHIAYVDIAGTTVHIAAAVESDTTTNINFEVDHNISAIAFSRDGQYLAITYGSSPQILQVINTSNVLENLRVVVLPEGLPRDGMYWVDDNRIVMLLENCDLNASQLYMAHLDTQQVTELNEISDYYICTRSSAGYTFWSLSPDGTQLAYATPEENGETTLYLLKLDTGESTQVMEGVDIYAPAWQP